MFLFLVRRILSTIPVLLTVAVFVFLILRIGPGDPAAVLAGDTASLQQIEEIRTRLGLNEPLYKQFAIWMGQLATGDLGESFFFKMPVADLIAQRVQPTLALAVVTIILSASWRPTGRGRSSTVWS